jgi:hypothetical protein
MAVVVEKYTREDGHEIAVYESGAQYDLTAGRLVGAPPRAQFTKESSLAAVERRLELKREAVARGAAKVLESSGEWEEPIRDMDVIEAISEAVMLKALNPKDAKQVDAARYIETGMGLAENQTSSNVTPSNMAATAIGTELARQFMAIIGDVMQAKAAISADPAGPVINIEADTDIRNE